MKKIVLLFLCLSFFGCAASGPRAGTFQSEGLKIGKVEASIDEKNIDSYPLEVFNQMGGKEDIITDVLNMLKQRNLYDERSNVRMDIRIVDFRLRHGATRAFTGFFSGSDKISANVDVTRNGSTIVTKKIEGSGGNGNPFKVSRESRGGTLFHYLADQSVGMLAREQVNK